LFLATRNNSLLPLSSWHLGVFAVDVISGRSKEPPYIPLPVWKSFERGSILQTILSKIRLFVLTNFPQTSSHRSGDGSTETANDGRVTRAVQAPRNTNSLWSPSLFRRCGFLPRSYWFWILPSKHRTSWAKERKEPPHHNSPGDSPLWRLKRHKQQQVIPPTHPHTHSPTTDQGRGGHYVVSPDKTEYEHRKKQGVAFPGARGQSALV
jgi:hypothetical protein